MSKLKITKPEFHSKGWGQEVWVTNNDKFCGKILEFKPNSRFSVHFHLKFEIFFVWEGEFVLVGIDGETAEQYELCLKPGDVVEIPSLFVHQLITNTGGRIVEFSTPHDEKGSFRIEAGDSQKKCSL